MSMTIHRCNCGHKHIDHERVDGSACSLGYCKCRLSVSAVVASNPPTEVQTFPGFDMATNKWATRETGEWS